MIYKISEFANIAGVSTQALKLYERKGLLVPAKIDKKTGYRFYEASQITRFEKIAELKTLGFSLADIGEMLSSKSTVEEKINKLEEHKTVIEGMIENLKFFKDNEHNYKITRSTERAMKYVSVELEMDDISQTADKCLEAIKILADENVKVIKPYEAFVSYVNKQFSCTKVKAMFNFAVKGAVLKRPTSYQKDTEFISTIHKNGRSSLDNAVSFLRAYADYNSLSIKGFPEEKIVFSKASDGSLKSELTEIRFPLEIQQ